MTIDELKIRKYQLETRMKLLIKDFQEETEVNVCDIDFEYTKAKTMSGTILNTSFTVKTTLDL